VERPEHEFHVVDNEIVIEFAVPLPVAGEDEVLTELLTHHAVEIINDRKSRGQPLDGIPIARVRASRGAESVQIVELNLEDEGMPDIEFPELLPTLDKTGYDPLAKLGLGGEGDVLPLAFGKRGDQLARLGDEIRLTAGLNAGLRTMGVNPETMTMAQLGPGLLRLAGYELTDRGDGSYSALGGGNTTFVQVIEHEVGEYPELEVRQISAFLVAFAGSRADRGLLLTDKFGPYELYQRERANPRCAFITRERLQGFVDSVALG